MRTRSYLYLLMFTILISLSVKTSAQVDPHFSQYYAYPLYLSPAFAGVIDGGDYRATAIYKNQWLSVGTPYSTVGVSADMTAGREVNLGVNILNQTAGDGGYDYLQGAFSLAYQGLKFDEQGYKRVIFGIQVGWINRRFDPAKLQFGDQWVAGIGFDPNIPTSEIFTRTSATSFDAGAGVSYFDNDPQKDANIYGGFSMNHLTQPYDPFLADGLKRRLPIRYTVDGGVKISLVNDIIFTPNFIYMRQGNAEERMIGAYFQMPTSDPSTDIMAGLSCRIQDAIVPYAGLKHNNLQFGLSYDANISSLGQSVFFTNSLELSITITGKRSESAQPHFACPPRF
jgi:type IX secretion system PorP/SprF family membrane protein